MAPRVVPVGALWLVDDDQRRFARLRAGETVATATRTLAEEARVGGWHPFVSWTVTNGWLQILPVVGPPIRVPVTTAALDQPTVGLTVFLAARHWFDWEPEVTRG